MVQAILIALVVATLFPAINATAAAAQLRAHVGETYEITRINETSQQSNAQSTGSSYDKDTMSERVIAVRSDGVELEYDLPKATTKEDRDRQWQFPVRVFKPNRGPTQLLNRADVEARVGRWLKAANWPRTVCGHWIFTWNAFRIDCDPESVIQTIEAFDLRPADIRDGAAYTESAALAPGTLGRKSTGPNGETFSAEMPIDPMAVHRAEAESDVVVGEIMRKPVTFEAALRQRMKEAVSGTILVTFELDPGGTVRRRTKVTKLEIKEPDGHSETRTATETLERRRIS
jgi:hypothetical protein